MPASTRSIVVGSLLFLALAAVIDARPAQGQEISCEEVSYNERIIITCRTIEGSTTTSTPTPEPTATPTPTPTVQDEDADAAPQDSEDEAEPDPDAAETATADTDDDNAEGEDDAVVDRGDRGSRDPAAELDSPTPLPGEFEAAATTETTPDTEVADEEAAQEAADSDVESSADQTDVAEDTGPVGVFDSTPDPPPDSMAIIAGLAALVGLGGAFFVAARSNRRQATT